MAEVQVSNIDFSSNDLSNIDFSGHDLTNKDFSGKNLSFSVFTNANLSGAIFSGCILNQTRLGPIINPPETISQELSIIEFGSSPSKFFWIVGPNLNLIEIDMSGKDLSNLNLSNCNLSRANLRTVTGINLNLTNANLTGADLTNANLSGANLTNANLTGANLTNANLTGVTINNTNIYKAILPTDMNKTNTISKSGFRLETQSSLNIKESNDITYSSFAMDLILGETYKFNLLYNKNSVYTETKMLELPVIPSMTDILLLEPTLSIQNGIVKSKIKVTIKYRDDAKLVKLLLVDINNNKTIDDFSDEFLKNKNKLITKDIEITKESRQSRHEYRLIYSTIEGYYDNTRYLLLNYFNPIKTEDFKDTAFIYSFEYGKIKLLLSFLETLYFQINIKNNISKEIYDIYTIYEKDTYNKVYYIPIEVPFNNLKNFDIEVNQYNISINAVIIRSKTFTTPMNINDNYKLWNSLGGHDIEYYKDNLDQPINTDFRTFIFDKYLSEQFASPLPTTVLLPKEYYYINYLIVGPNIKINSEYTLKDLTFNKLNLKGLQFLSFYPTNILFNLCNVDDKTTITKTNNNTNRYSPIMNISTTEYIATSSSSKLISYGYEAYKVFDNKASTFWTSLNEDGYHTSGNANNLYKTTVNLYGELYGEWVQIEFPMGKQLYPVVQFEIYLYNYGNINFFHEKIYLVGSQNGTNWDMVYDSFALLGKNISYGTTISSKGKNIELLIPSNQTPYRFYRYIINKSTTKNICFLNELIFYTSPITRTIQYFNTKNDDNIEYSIILEDGVKIDYPIKNINFNKYIENVNFSNVQFINCSFISDTKNIKCSPETQWWLYTYILSNGYFIGKGVKYTDLSNTIFRYFGSSDINRDVSSCNLTCCDFRDFDISGMNFTNSTLRDYIPGPLLIKPLNVTLPSGYKIVESNINGIKSYYLLGPYVDLTNITINGCDLAGVDLSNAIISNTQITAYFLPTSVEHLPNKSSYTFIYDEEVSKLHNMIGPYVNINGMELYLGIYYKRFFPPERTLDEIILTGVRGTCDRSVTINSNYQSIEGIILGPNINLASNNFIDIFRYDPFYENIHYSTMYFKGLKVNPKSSLIFFKGSVDYTPPNTTRYGPTNNTGLIDLTNKDFSFGDFSNCILFYSCNLSGSNFDNCKLYKTSFYNSNFSNCSFKNFYMNNSTFLNCSFENVQFENNIWDAHAVQHCSFDNATFTNSKCLSSFMTNNKLTNIKFSNTIINSTTFNTNTLSSDYISTGKGLKGKGVIDYIPTITYPSLFFENTIENYLHRLVYSDITTYTSYTNDYIFFKNNIVNEYILNKDFYVKNIQSTQYEGNNINFGDNNIFYNQLNFIGPSGSTETIRNDTFSLFQLNFLIFLTILTSISLVNQDNTTLITTKTTDMIGILNNIKTVVSGPLGPFNFDFNLTDNKYINEYTDIITVTGPQDFSLSDQENSEYDTYKASNNSINSYDSSYISSSADMLKIENYNKIIKFNVKDLQLSKIAVIANIDNCLTEINKIDYTVENINKLFITLIKELNKLNSALVKKYHIVFKLFAIENPNIDINFSKKVDMYMNEYTYTSYANTQLDTNYDRLDINSVKNLNNFLSLYDSGIKNTDWKKYVSIQNFLAGSFRLSETILHVLIEVEEFMSNYNTNASKKHIFIFNKFLSLYKPIISLLISIIKRVSFQNIQELIKKEVKDKNYSTNFNINYSDMKINLQTVLAEIQLEHILINTETIYSIELKNIYKSIIPFIEELKKGNKISITVDINFENISTKIITDPITPIYKVITGIITCPNCDFSNTPNLYKYDFSGCNLTNSNFSNCVLANSLNGIVTKVNFKNAILSGVNFSGCKFSIPVINDAVYKFELDNFNLSGCNFSGCDLGGVSIKGANMSNTILPSIISVLYYDLSTNFTGIKTESSSYNYTHISQLCMGPVNTLLIGGYKVLFFDNKYFFIGPNTNIDGVDFSGQNLLDIDVTNSNIYNVTYDLNTIPPKYHKFIQSNGIGCLVGPTVKDWYIYTPNTKSLSINNFTDSNGKLSYNAFDDIIKGTGWVGYTGHIYYDISSGDALLNMNYTEMMVNNETDLEGPSTFFGQWVQVDMNYPYSISSFKIFMYIGENGNNEKIMLAGSNDNINWELVYDSYSSLGKIITYQIVGNHRYNIEKLIPTNSKKYRYFRYIIKKITSNNYRYAILKYLELNAYVDIVFANNNLSKVVLSNKDLTNKNFNNCNLSYASFDYSDLTNCILSNTILYNTDLSKAVLKGIKSGGILNYKNCKLPYGYIIRYGFILGPDVDLTNLSLFNNVDKLLLFDPTIEEPDNQLVSDNTLTTLNISLNGIDLRWYDLDGCIAGPFTGTPSYLPGTNWKIVKDSSNKQYLVGPKISFKNLVIDGCDFDYAYLNNVDFTNTTLKNVTFINSDLTGILSSININSTNIILPSEYKVVVNTGSTLKIIAGPNVNLSRLNLNNFIFENINLTGVNFNDATFTNTGLPTNQNIFINCILKNVNFSGLNKSYIMYTSNPINGINFDGLDLDGCNFTNTYLCNSTFINSNLNNVRFINSNLDYTCFKKNSDNKSEILNFDNTIFYNVKTNNAIL